VTKSPFRIKLLLLLGLLGFSVSLYQTNHFFQLRSGELGFKSFCTFGAFDCEAIEASTHATLFAGLPVSQFAAGWFLAIALISLIATGPIWRRDAFRWLLAMIGFGCAFSIYFLYIMISVIGSYCLLCLIVDAILFLSLGLILSLKVEAFKEHKFDPEKVKNFIGITAFTLVATFLMGLGMDNGAPKKFVKTAVESVLSKDPISLTPNAESPSFGPEDAPITLVKFSDFECPACRRAALATHPLFKRYKNKIRFIFRNFPLNPGCNRKVKRAGHPAACLAARAAMCANRQGKFRSIYETFFEHQAELKPGTVLELVARTGDLDIEKIKICMESDSVKDAISRDVEEGIRVGVQSTPTFFINGKKVSGSFPTDVWVKIIDALLKNSK